ncbi:hypothetical protein BX600DRAFT_446314 [Xylariales sp. PMI_506]|nr:hypothetical protein BX600DRAFT_446314 [Xylariales sp. PMI_506]
MVPLALSPLFFFFLFFPVSTHKALDFLSYLFSSIHNTSSSAGFGLSEGNNYRAVVTPPSTHRSSTCSCARLGAAMPNCRDRPARTLRPKGPRRGH